MDKIIILDFGSQYTQLIARRVRELNVNALILPYNKEFDFDDGNVKGLILSGSPCSVRGENVLDVDLSKYLGKKPVLGICYGAQYIAHNSGGNVEQSDKREYGAANLNRNNIVDPLIEGVVNSQVWMSHADSITSIGDNYEVMLTTDSIPVAAYRAKPGVYDQPVYGVQFHPEVTHSVDGKVMLDNFVTKICKASKDWTSEKFVDDMVSSIKEQVGDDKVIIGLSGGVDSSVAAAMIHKAIGSQLTGIFVNNGVLRKNEFEEVTATYKQWGLNVLSIDASDEFLDALDGVSDPERKRKIIGSVFIDVFQREAAKITDAKWLAQGTIYPDVIESVSVFGPSVTIKSHHNVGGLPEHLNLQLLEPLRMLFKDEVRRVGKYMEVDDAILSRHPFPGPGLAIRILGEISREKIKLNQDADAIFINALKESGWYDKVWQAGTMLLPVKSVGVMGDERTYEYTLALRCVNSTDGMTAEWSKLPYELLANVSNTIINTVKGINRVVYDISTKPPATIEWE